MPIAQVTCCICNQVVNKAQTLSVGNGRACRSHPQTVVKAQEIKDKVAQEKKAQEKIDQKSKPLTLAPTCSCCGKEGITQQEYGLQILTEIQKFELTYNRHYNFLDPEDTQKVLSGMKGKRCLWLMNYSPKVRVLRELKPAAQAFNIIAICPDCCKEQDIDPHEGKKITLETLIEASAVYEGLVKPVLREEAAKELAAKTNEI